MTGVRRTLTAIIVPLLALLTVVPAVHSAAAGRTPSVTLAAGYRIDVVSAALVAPRAVLPVTADLAYVTQFSWTKNKGSLVRLTRSASGWKATTVLSKLDRPGGLALGPDGKLYVGEVGRVSRIDLSKASLVREPVITDLPGKGLHPLATFAFTATGDLIVNTGSSTDSCDGQKGKATCAEVEGRAGLGGLRLYHFAWPAGRVTGWDRLAQGLRNSMALAVHPSGTILEADNGRDAINDADPKLSDALLPHDELNVIESGRNYGWPYCYDDRTPSPEFRSYDCAATVAPQTLIPAHAAPLGMAYWDGKLVVGYHGYRDNGHRLVAFPIDAKGVPNGPSTELIGGWVEKSGQELGGPVGIAAAPDGSLWVTDDRNNMVIRLTKAP